MPEHRPDRAHPDRDAQRTGAALPAGQVAVLVIAILASAGIGGRYWIRGDLDVIHAIVSLFFSVNLVVCYWEICLFFRRDHIEQRAQYWRDRRRETGRSPVVEFLGARVPLAKLFSSTLWADVWATYAQYDGSYADRRTYGFNVDIANGFATPVPTLILYAAYSVDLMPALVAGIIGAMLFWQLIYMTSVYWVSFFVSRSAIADQPAGEVYLYLRIELPLGALRAAWIIRLHSLDRGRRLQRPGPLIRDFPEQRLTVARRRSPRCAITAR